MKSTAPGRGPDAAVAVPQGPGLPPLAGMIVYVTRQRVAGRRVAGVRCEGPAGATEHCFYLDHLTPRKARP